MKRSVIATGLLCFGLVVGTILFGTVTDLSTLKTNVEADIASNTTMFLQPTVDVIDSLNPVCTLTTAVTATDTTITHPTIDELSQVGDLVVVEAFATDAEIVRVTVIGSNSVTVSPAFSANHDIGDQIIILRADGPISVQLWGAVGDLTNDDTLEIQSSADAIQALEESTTEFYHPVMVFPAVEGYLTTSTITIQEGISVMMDAPIYYNGGSQSVGALVIGETNVENNQVKLKLEVERGDGVGDDTSDWTNEGSVGIKLINSLNNDIEVVGIGGRSNSGFTIGLQCLGSSDGFSFNSVRLGRIVNNKISVDCANQDTEGGDAGFCNENLFLGGRIAVGSSIMVGTDRIGIRLKSLDGTNKNINNNVFTKPSIEINDHATHEALPIQIVHGRSNRFLSARNEGNGPMFARVLNDPTLDNRHNVFDYVREVGIVDDQDTDASSIVVYSDTKYINRPLRKLYDSGPMHLNAVDYDGGTNLHIANVHQLTSADDSVSVATAEGTNLYAWVNETFTVDTATEEFIDTAHEKQIDDIVFVTTSAADLPVPLVIDTLYYVISTTTDRFIVSTTRGGLAVNITDAGTGTHTYHSRNRYLTVALARGVGVWLDTREADRFVITRDIEFGNGGRIHWNAYDSSNDILINTATFTADSGTDVITSTAHGLLAGEKVYLAEVGTLPTGLLEDTVYFLITVTTNTFQLSLTSGGSVETFSTNGSGANTHEMVDRWIKSQPGSFWNGTVYSGAYRSSSDMDIDTTFTTRSEVERVGVMMSGGSNPLRIRSFQIYVADDQPMVDVWLGYNQGGWDRSLATATPASGTYTNISRPVWDHTPVNSTPIGWALGTAGSSGTWINMPEYGALAP